MRRRVRRDSASRCGSSGSSGSALVPFPGAAPASGGEANSVSRLESRKDDDAISGDSDCMKYNIYFKQLVNSKKVIVSTKQTKNGRTCWKEQGREAENKMEGNDGKVGNNSG